ncbi:hypothetical protein QTP86_020384 [Hemibagrus guttatus]|nr:hypothetical protein QTP86_020384 [Hemibagrus guttatus]
MDRTEENKQEYKELQRRVKREVSKANQKAYDELYIEEGVSSGYSGFLPRSKDMHCRLIGISKLSVVCDCTPVHRTSIFHSNLTTTMGKTKELSKEVKDKAGMGYKTISKKLGEKETEEIQNNQQSSLFWSSMQDLPHGVRMLMRKVRVQARTTQEELVNDLRAVGTKVTRQNTGNNTLPWIEILQYLQGPLLKKAHVQDCLKFANEHLNDSDKD